MPVICSYTMLLTVYYVPYTTIIMELSDDPAERDTATTWRMCDEPSRPALRL
jgi:Na+/melibiose symporter-like transporter|eukprot:COSAG06_NODE_1119_length_10634_cov_3.222117_16_plen_52_part_00